MNRRVLLLMVVVVVLATSGCMRVEPGPNAPTIINFYGEMNATDSGFTMDGQILMGGALPDQEVFEDVTVYLFTENGTLIKSHVAGDLSKPVNVTITAEKTPYYVIVDSPDFWSESHIKVEYYRRLDSNVNRDFGEVEIRSRDEYPVQIGDMDILTNG